MKFITDHKLIVLLIVVALGVGWWFLADAGGSSSTGTTITTQSTEGQSAGDQALVATLLQLRAVKLDGGILSDPVYKSLQDYSTAIIPEPVGRENPFAPLSLRATSSPDANHAAAIFTPSR